MLLLRLMVEPVTSKVPVPRLVTPIVISLVSVIATLKAPVLVRLTGPIKLLPRLIRVITPAPALKLAAPALAA